MASVNALARELVFKIVYYGPGLSGKTTTLQHIHATAKPEHRGKMVSLATPVDRTLYFDFLPVRLPNIRGMGVRLQLFTVPGQVYYNATRKLVLTGADAIVFVSDSQAARMDANFETLQNLNDNLSEHGRRLADVPHVIQHNKRDLPDVLELRELDEALNVHHAPSFGTAARSGEGVYEALDAIVQRVLGDFESTLPAFGGGVAAEFEAMEGGLAEALRGAHEMDLAVSHSPVVAGITTAPPSGEELAMAGADAPGERAARAVTRSELSGDRAAHPASVSTGREASNERPPRPRAVEGDQGMAKPSGGPSPSRISLAELWPEADRDGVREAEAAIASGHYAQAIELCDALVVRVLASAARLFGSADAPRDASTVPLLLGLDGRRYLGFRALVRDARSGVSMDVQHALEALVFAADARVLRASL